MVVGAGRSGKDYEGGWLSRLWERLNIQPSCVFEDAGKMVQRSQMHALHTEGCDPNACTTHRRLQVRGPAQPDPTSTAGSSPQTLLGVSPKHYWIWPQNKYETSRRLVNM